MGPSKMLKCHISHGNFCKVPNPFSDHMPKFRKFSSLAALNCWKFSKNLDRSWQLWEIAETKILAGPSHITWPAKLIEMPLYSTFFSPFITIRASHELTRGLIRIRPAGISLFESLIWICTGKFPWVTCLNGSGTCSTTDHPQLTGTCRYPQVSTDTC